MKVNIKKTVWKSGPEIGCGKPVYPVKSLRNGTWLADRLPMTGKANSKVHGLHPATASAPVCILVVPNRRLEKSLYTKCDVQSSSPKKIARPPGIAGVDCNHNHRKRIEMRINDSSSCGQCRQARISGNTPADQRLIVHVSR